MTLWTLVVEYVSRGGGTLVFQVPAESPCDAVRFFADSEIAKECEIEFDKPHKGDEISDGNPPVKVSGVENVWCFADAIGDEEILLINIIETVSFDAKKNNNKDVEHNGSLH